MKREFLEKREFGFRYFGVRRRGRGKEGGLEVLGHLVEGLEEGDWGFGGRVLEIHGDINVLLEDNGFILLNQI